MHFARSLVVLAALAASPAAAEPCRFGTNMPAGDANPAKPTAVGQARMVCEQRVVEARGRDGSTTKFKTWQFDLKK